MLALTRYLAAAAAFIALAAVPAVANAGPVPMRAVVVLSEQGVPMTWKSVDFFQQARDTLMRSAEAQRLYLGNGALRAGGDSLRSSATSVPKRPLSSSCTQSLPRREAPPLRRAKRRRPPRTE